MGWARGSSLMGDLICAVMVVDNEKIRAKIYRRMITAFEDYDCDTLDECRGIDLVFDEVLDEMG